MSSSVKIRSALAGQFILERVTLTCSVSPGARLPLDGLKNTPGALLDADQSRLVSLFGSLLSVTLQSQTCSLLPTQSVLALMVLPGPIVSAGDFVQFHGTETVYRLFVQSPLPLFCCWQTSLCYFENPKQVPRSQCRSNHYYFQDSWYLH